MRPEPLIELRAQVRRHLPLVLRGKMRVAERGLRGLVAQGKPDRHG